MSPLTCHIFSFLNTKHIVILVHRGCFPISKLVFNPNTLPWLKLNEGRFHFPMALNGLLRRCHSAWRFNGFVLMLRCQCPEVAGWGVWWQEIEWFSQHLCWMNCMLQNDVFFWGDGKIVYKRRGTICYIYVDFPWPWHLQWLPQQGLLLSMCHFMFGPF